MNTNINTKLHVTRHSHGWLLIKVAQEGSVVTTVFYQFYLKTKPIVKWDPKLALYCFVLYIWFCSGRGSWLDWIDLKCEHKWFFEAALCLRLLLQLLLEHPVWIVCSTLDWIQSVQVKRVLGTPGFLTPSPEPFSKGCKKIRSTAIVTRETNIDKKSEGQSEQVTAMMTETVGASDAGVDIV